MLDIDPLFNQLPLAHDICEIGQFTSRSAFTQIAIGSDVSFKDVARLVRN
ncbi:hypothetical protein SAMN05444714_0625 [Yoonia litorea]|uniref:Uncharacterized protein n=1 Tax=Yoonia litorea TaxID=1123755 RepID=A0A1I6LKU0_9RHOB|nr:hypothetical protein SAMN05444714_0625 [Yoonia litorea]